MRKTRAQLQMSRPPRRRYGSDANLQFSAGADTPEDVYQILERDGRLEVRHFANLETAKVCCLEVVEITEADRRYEHGGEIAALARAQRTIDDRHGDR